MLNSSANDLEFVVNKNNLLVQMYNQQDHEGDDSLSQKDSKNICSPSLEYQNQAFSLSDNKILTKRRSIFPSTPEINIHPKINIQSFNQASNVKSTDNFVSNNSIISNIMSKNVAFESNHQTHPLTVHASNIFKNMSPDKIHQLSDETHHQPHSITAHASNVFENMSLDETPPPAKKSKKNLTNFPETLVETNATLLTQFQDYEKGYSESKY